MKSWRKSSTGKIWSIYHLKMSDITKEKIGKKIVCGMCGKSAGKGYHLTTYILGLGDDDLTPDYDSLSPRLPLMGLESHQMVELSKYFAVLDRLEAANFHLLDFMHWFVNDCCRAKFRRDCWKLGFKIDREKLSQTCRRSLNQAGLYQEKRKR